MFDKYTNHTIPRTSGETYFFRDQGQFDLLRLCLLPELIEHRRSEKSLRLWSAGCSSGEEAYSLAMLVDMLLPKHENWNIFILGSDINQQALEKARHGHYRQWSFRTVLPAWKQRYFQPAGDEWLLDERIRRMVTWRTLDLIETPFPDEELRNMDLILCRNVFIYFDADVVAAVANKLTATLNDGGYLMTGHIELIGHHVRELRSRLFADGVVYQRTSSPTPLHIESAVSTCVLPPIEPFTEDILRTAQGFADRGEYEQAEQQCLQALKATPLAVKPYFLLAQLAQLRGDFGQAKELLDKVLYLDANYVAAYLELAALYERIENLSQAQTLRHMALGIVHALPSEVIIEPYETTAAEMMQWLAQCTAKTNSESIKVC